MAAVDVFFGTSVSNRFKSASHWHHWCFEQLLTFQVLSPSLSTRAFLAHIPSAARVLLPGIFHKGNGRQNFPSTTGWSPALNSLRRSVQMLLHGDHWGSLSELSESVNFLLKLRQKKLRWSSLVKKKWRCWTLSSLNIIDNSLDRCLLNRTESYLHQRLKSGSMSLPWMTSCRPVQDAVSVLSIPYDSFIFFHGKPSPASCYSYYSCHFCDFCDLSWPFVTFCDLLWPFVTFLSMFFVHFETLL